MRAVVPTAVGSLQDSACGWGRRKYTGDDPLDQRVSSVPLLPLTPLARSVHRNGGEARADEDESLCLEPVERTLGPRRFHAGTALGGWFISAFGGRTRRLG